MPVPGCFHLDFVLYDQFLSQTSLTYTYNVCMKYWAKSKNLMVVDSEILLLKDNLPHFTPVYAT